MINIKPAYIMLWLVWIAVMSSGCAYYNYLYNARKSYDEGEKSRREQTTETRPKTGTQSKTPYNKAIESAGRMLEYYPDSRWEPEALLLLAKAYYRTGQYRSSITKVQELSLKYPLSGLLAEGELWRGLSLLKVAQADSALLTLSKLTAPEVDVNLRAQALFGLAEYYNELERWESAQAQYRRVIETEVDDEWLVGETWVKIGFCLSQLNRYEEAVDLYGKLLKSKGPRKLKFTAKLELGIALRYLGRYEEALETFDELLDDRAFAEEFPRVKLEMAKCLRSMERYEESRQTLDDLVSEEKRGSVLAKAQYELGEITWTHWRNSTEAMSYLTDASKTDRTVLEATLADSLRNEIEQLSKYWQNLRFFERQAGLIDSFYTFQRLILPSDTVYVDSLSIAQKEMERQQQKKGAARQRRREGDPIAKMVEEAIEREEREKKGSKKSAKGDSTAVVDNVVTLDSVAVEKLRTKRSKDYESALFELASFHLFKRSDLDSSYFYFNKITELSTVASDSSDNQPIEHASALVQATAALAYIASQKGDNESADSLYRQIIETNPDSDYANHARKMLGLDIEAPTVDSLGILLAQAEDTWVIHKDYLTAKGQYLAISQVADSNSAVRARALLGAALLTRVLNPEDTLSKELYSQVLKENPNTEYGKFAREKGGIPEPKLREERKPKEDRGQKSGRKRGNIDDEPPIIEDPEADPFNRMYPEMFNEFEEDRIFNPDEVDELPVLKTSQAMLRSYISSNYPFRAYDEKVKGTVELEFTVGNFGDVFDIVPVSVDPEGYEFEEAAEQVLNSLSFNPGRFRGRPVTVRMKQKFEFDAGSQ